MFKIGFDRFLNRFPKFLPFLKQVLQLLFGCNGAQGGFQFLFKQLRQLLGGHGAFAEALRRPQNLLFFRLHSYEKRRLNIRP